MDSRYSDAVIECSIIEALHGRIVKMDCGPYFGKSFAKLLALPGIHASEACRVLNVMKRRGIVACEVKPREVEGCARRTTQIKCISLRYCHGATPTAQSA